MALTWAWTGMMLLSVLYSLGAGTAARTGAAALEGAAAAVRLAAGMLGGVMLWSGLMEVMERAGLTALLARLLRPVLARLFPSGREDEALMEDLSCNLSANLLGLGNAATPAGIRAAERLRRHAGQAGSSRELSRLVVMNTASVQLLPVTMAALRASLGAAEPYDVLPAVWVASALSVAAGLLVERALPSGV